LKLAQPKFPSIPSLNKMSQDREIWKLWGDEKGLFHAFRENSCQKIHTQNAWAGRSGMKFVKRFVPKTLLFTQNVCRHGKNGRKILRTSLKSFV
jgi:hypothetical protein